MTDWRNLFFVVMNSRWGDDELRRRAYRDLYHVYLKSPEWNIKRESCAKQSNYTCERCGYQSRIWKTASQIGYSFESVRHQVMSEFDVHHITYYSIGRESLDDLLFLCKSCHKTHHRKHGDI